MIAPPPPHTQAHQTSAAADRYVDLHVHSTASDGVVAPTQVVETAQHAGLSAIALTDHDTIDGVAAAQEAGIRLGVRIVAGCELSAHDGASELHLLALHIADTDSLRVRLAEFREQRIERAHTMVQRLNARGVALSFEDVLSAANGGAVGRPHVARALLQRGYVTDLQEAFNRYLAYGRSAYVAKPQLLVRDAIDIAHQAGALAIWAHPGKEGTREHVQRLVDAGLDGLEVRHPSHTIEDTQRLTQFVDEFALVANGGSDWHGAMEGYRVLGSMHVPQLWLDLQDARLAALAV